MARLACHAGLERRPTAVVVASHKLAHDLRSEVRDEPYVIPFGEANIVRDGDDVTVVALAQMVHYGGEAAEALAKEGIECELIDPRTTSRLATPDARPRMTPRLEAGYIIPIGPLSSWSAVFF